MKIQKSKNNKGHGAPIIPDWLYYIGFALILAALSIASYSILFVIRLCGFLTNYNMALLIVIMNCILIGWIYAEDKYKDYQAQKEWEKHKEGRNEQK